MTNRSRNNIGQLRSDIDRTVVRVARLEKMVKIAVVSGVVFASATAFFLLL